MRERLLKATPWLALALVGLLAFGNAWRYTHWIANPLVLADSWYFLDAFVQPWSEGELDWRHFFAKRDSSDHAQPLHRLSLLANLEWARLDFVFEARLGLIGLGLCLLLLCALAALHLRRHGHPQRSLLATSVPLLLLPPMALSLNSHEIYYWSLVNFFHLSLLPGLILLAYACWQLAEPGSRLRGRALWATFALSLLVQLALDGAGLLAVAALLPVLAWGGWRLARGREAAWLAAALLAGLLVYRGLYALLMPPVPISPAGGLLPGLARLLGHAEDSWRWLLLPATASLVQPLHLPFWLSADWVGPAQHGLGLLALVAHGAFWLSQLREREPRPLGLFTAALMLLSYGMWAGILLSRLPVFGTEYLLQSRYVAFYQLANLALLLQLLVVLARRPRPAIPVAGGAALALLLVLGLGLQHLLSKRAWEHGVHIREYAVNMAANLVCLGEHPGLEAPVCQAGNVVCEGGSEHRDRRFALLREKQLNLYAPGFLERHDMTRALGSTSCIAAPPAP